MYKFLPLTPKSSNRNTVYIRYNILIGLFWTVSMKFILKTFMQCSDWINQDYETQTFMTVGHNSFGHTSFEFHSLTPKTSNLTCLIVRMSLILVLQQCPLRILYLVYIYIYGWFWSTNTNLFSKKNNYDYIYKAWTSCTHGERSIRNLPFCIS